ncbi:hypothetical protein BCEP4_830018 [Burkholderia cepacia]|nr:hypothetical protein WL32_20830 [Burkholderia cepacia]CAG9273604.1 hypothetical protein BCEP4_830018 [Burkholderia cepacia]
MMVADAHVECEFRVVWQEFPRDGIEQKATQFARQAYTQSSCCGGRRSQYFFGVLQAAHQRGNALIKRLTFNRQNGGPGRALE